MLDFAENPGIDPISNASLCSPASTCLNNVPLDDLQHRLFLMSELPGRRKKIVKDGLKENRILSIGDDPALLITRQMVLESEGFLVHSISSREAGIYEQKEIQEVDLVLICHSVEEACAAAIAELLKENHPGLPIVLLSSGYDRLVHFDEQIASPEPQNLLTSIKQMLHPE